MNRINGLIKALPALMLVYISMIYNLFNVEDKSTSFFKVMLIMTLILLIVSLVISIFHRKVYFKKNATEKFCSFNISNRYYYLDRFNTWIIIITPIVIFNDSTTLSVFLAFVVSLFVLIIISNENLHIHNLVFLIFYNMYEAEYNGELIVIVTRLKRNEITMGTNFDGFKIKEGHPVYLVTKSKVKT